MRMGLFNISCANARTCISNTFFQLARILLILTYGDFWITLCVCVCVYIYIYMCVCVCICIYIIYNIYTHIYTHTYIHIYVCECVCVYFHDSTALVGQVFRDHIRTHHTRYDYSERMIGPSQRPLPDNTQHSQETGVHAYGGIRNHNPNKRAAADSRLRPQGHRIGNGVYRHLRKG